jgi:hypothetical protein
MNLGCYKVHHHHHLLIKFASSFRTSTGSPLNFDHPPPQGFRSRDYLYARTKHLDVNDDELLMVSDEPSNYLQASGDKNWQLVMQKEWIPLKETRLIVDQLIDRT